MSFGAATDNQSRDDKPENTFGQKKGKGAEARQLSIFCPTIMSSKQVHK